MHYARASRRLGAGRGTGSGTLGVPFRQRCAVRVTYSPNRISGQWRAHGKSITLPPAVLPHPRPAGQRIDCHDTKCAPSVFCHRRRLYQQHLFRARLTRAQRLTEWIIDL